MHNLSTKNQIILLIQTFHQEFNKSPSTRAIINYANNKNPELNLDSILFHELFPNGISEACETAGIPKSTCI